MVRQVTFLGGFLLGVIFFILAGRVKLAPSFIPLSLPEATRIAIAEKAPLGCSLRNKLISPLNHATLLSGKKNLQSVVFRWQRIDAFCHPMILIKNVYHPSKEILLKAGSSGVIENLPDGIYQWSVMTTSLNSRKMQSEKYVFEISEHKNNLDLLVLSEKPKP
jgi:hypothetical protein